MLGKVSRSEKIVPDTFFLQLQVAAIRTHTATPITTVEVTTPAVKQVKASKVAHYGLYCDFS